jgi:hypothetical protein
VITVECVLSLSLHTHYIGPSASRSKADVHTHTTHVISIECVLFLSLHILLREAMRLLLILRPVCRVYVCVCVCVCVCVYACVCVFFSVSFDVLNGISKLDLLKCQKSPTIKAKETY